MCASALMCSPVRAFKAAEKFPPGRGDPGAELQVARPSRRNLCLSFMFSVALSPFSLLLAFSLFLYRHSPHFHVLCPRVCPLQGERCSFSVQMWFYFLCGLRSDLWAVLPADFAKEMLGQVLSETLQLLVQRYSSVRPSYRRQLQVRCDSCALKFNYFFHHCYTQSLFLKKMYSGNLVYQLQRLCIFPPNSCFIQHLKTV